MQLVCPIESTPIVLCIGLNYKQHAKEASVGLPFLLRYLRSSLVFS